MLVVTFFVQLAIECLRNLRERKDRKSFIRRKLEMDETHIQFLLEQSEQSLEYAQCYLKQTTSRTGESIAHSFGNAAALPLLLVFLTFYKELGVIGWIQSAFADGHPSNPALIRLVFFVCAVAFLAFAGAYGLLAQQRRDSYKLGLVEIALKLKAVRGSRESTLKKNRRD